MKYDFDKIEQQDKYSTKWNNTHNTENNFIAMWIADMDFATLPEVVDALKKRVECGIFGYTLDYDEYKTSIVDWMKRRHSCIIENEWLVLTPGVLVALNIAIQAFTKRGDNILVQTPIYPPFFYCPKNNEQIVIENRLLLKDNKYEIDFDDLENKLSRTSFFILCSPHNPTGKVFTRYELEKIVFLCRKYKVFIFSDEIHQDLVYKNHKQISLIDCCRGDENYMVATAASKTFNIAGLVTSTCIIPNEKTRERFVTQKLSNDPKSVNLFGKIATQTAYLHGDKWLDELLIYLENNKDFALQYFRENIPLIKVAEPQGTYLLWLNCKDLNLPNDKLENFFRENANILLNDGLAFGQAGFMRMNIACPKARLEQALVNIKNAVQLIK